MDTKKNINFEILKTVILLSAALITVHMGCGATDHGPETSWRESISTLCARDPSLDEHAVMELLTPIMTQ